MDWLRSGTPLPVSDEVRTAPLILVGYHGGASSLRATAFAIGAATRQRADLLFLQVWELPAAYGLLPPVVPVYPEVIAETHAATRDAIADLVGELDVGWRLRHAVGHPLQELNRVAHEVRADAVIVGSSRRTGWRPPGSLGSKLVRARRCPVTVVP